MKPEYERLLVVANKGFGGLVELSKKMGKNTSTLYGYQYERNRIGRKILEDLERVGINSQYILYGTEPMFNDNLGTTAVENFQPADPPPQAAAPRVAFSAPSPQNRGLFLSVREPHQPILVPLMLTPVRAGILSYASEDVDQYVDVAKHYNENTFMCYVQGESMQDVRGAGITEGMRLVVDTGREPKHNDILIAEHEGKLTLKRLRRNGKQWLLMPDNPEYPPIELDDSFKIIGVVRKAELVFS